MTNFGKNRGSWRLGLKNIHRFGKALVATSLQRLISKDGLWS
jgi:hypothetical protein